MYMLFLDESGFGNPKIVAQYPEADFFVIGGILLKEENYSKVINDFIDFKHANLPPKVHDLPLHAHELNQIDMPNTKQNIYKGILTPKQAKEILQKSYEFIATLPIEAIAIIIDNIEFRKKYSQPYNSYLMSYKMMIEKFQAIIAKRGEPSNSHGVVTIAHSQMARKLTESHEDLIVNGTEYIKFTTVFSKLAVKTQKECIPLQIADLVAYAYNRSYRNYLCKNLGKESSNEGYLYSIRELAKGIRIGNVMIGDSVRTKIFPKARFL